MEQAITENGTTETSRAFEDTYNQLEDLVGQLETGDLSLDEALSTYERGVGALKRCYRILDAAERKLEILVQNQDDSLETRPVDLGELRKEARGSAQGGRTSLKYRK